MSKSDFTDQPTVMRSEQLRQAHPAVPERSRRPLLVRVAEERWAADCSCRRDQPAFDTLWLVRDGRLWLRHEAGEHECGPGSLVVLPRGRSRFAVVAHSGPAHLLLANGAGPGWPLGRAIRHLPAATCADDIAALLQVALGYGEQGNSGEAIAHQTWATCCELVRHLIAREAASGSDPGRQRFADCRALIDDAYRQLPDATAAAERCGLHPDHLARLFQRYLHITASAYLRRARMQYAARRLADPRGCTLDELADELHYGDGFSLSKAFKRHFGCAPATWRRRVQR